MISNRSISPRQLVLFFHPLLYVGLNYGTQQYRQRYNDGYTGGVNLSYNGYSQQTNIGRGRGRLAPSSVRTAWIGVGGRVFLFVLFCFVCYCYIHVVLLFHSCMCCPSISYPFCFILFQFGCFFLY
jgi:hypothetical protein